MATTREKVEELLADVLPRLEALKGEALAEIAEAQERASERISRYQAAAEELEGVEARLMMLEAEREGLPTDHSRAILEDDVDEELRVKERFATVAEEISDLGDRKAALEGELRRLVPRPRRHRYDAMIEQTAQVATAAAREREALEDLEKRLAEVLASTVRPVADKHNSLRALVETRSREREWDETVEVRARVV
jgi:hypothetical protein